MRMLWVSVRIFYFLKQDTLIAASRHADLLSFEIWDLKFRDFANKHKISNLKFQITPVFLCFSEENEICRVKMVANTVVIVIRREEAEI